MSNQPSLSTAELQEIFSYSVEKGAGLVAPPHSRFASLHELDLRQAFIASHSRDLLNIWANNRRHHLLQPNEGMMQRTAQFMVYIEPGQYPFLDDYSAKHPQIVQSDVTSTLIGLSTQLAASRSLFLAIASEPKLPQRFAQELQLSPVQCQISRALVAWDLSEQNDQLQELSEATGKPIDELSDHPGIFDPIITRASSSFRDTWAIMAVLHAEVTRRHKEEFGISLSKENYKLITPKLKAMLLNVSSKGRSRFAEKMDALLAPDGINFLYDQEGKLEVSFSSPEFSEEALSTPYVVCPATMAHRSKDPADNVLSGLIDEYFEVVLDVAFEQKMPRTTLEIRI